MRQFYEATCPKCGAMVDCAVLDLMGFPTPERGDPDPLRTVCDSCGADLVMNWTVTLEEAEEEEGNND